MNNCQKCRSMYVEALYDELNQEQKKWFESHLSSCPNCANEYQEINATVGIMNQRTRPEPNSVFWNGYWDRLVDRMEAEEKSATGILAWWHRFWQSINFQPNLAYRIATVMALIAIGIFIGKLYFGRPVSQQIENIKTAEMHPKTIEQVSLQQRTDRYIERSKILLLGLINFDPESQDVYALDLPYQKQISKELVQEANVLKDDLRNPGQQQIRDLVEDLRIILLQIANLETEYDLAGIELVKSGVDRRGILLKINLEEMQDSGASKQISTKKGKI